MNVRLLVNVNLLLGVQSFVLQVSALFVVSRILEAKTQFSQLFEFDRLIDSHFVNIDLFSIALILQQTCKVFDVLRICDNILQFLDVLVVVADFCELGVEIGLLEELSFENPLVGGRGKK